MDRLDRASTILRSSGIFAGGIAVLVIAVVAASALAMARDGDLSADATPTFATSASGTVKLPPTGATTRVMLEGCGEGPGAAMQQLNGRFASMAKAWRAEDVPKDAISRGNVSTVQRSKTRWCSSLEAVVTVEDLDLLGAVMAGIERYPRGIQTVQGPIFEYDTKELERSAFDDAMELARRKADDAARRADMEVSGVRTITQQGVEVTRPEDTGRNDYPMPYATRGTVTASADMQQLKTAVTTQSGEATATATVEVVFTLED